MTRDLETRKAQADAHVKTLDELLKSKPPRETPQRLFRTKLWGDDLAIVTMIQNINVTPGPGQPDIKLQLFVTRPYTTPNSNGATVASLSLIGQYSLYEVVAFLDLDKVSTETVEWVDETKYSSVVVVGDILKRLH